jgi:glucosamine--fructose-6-phosphate aminotransferase (isomerizing)
MCGILGYVGKQIASIILLEGLRRLEYRGYDGAGVALWQEGKLEIKKKQGKIDEGLGRLLSDQPVHGTLGIGHTRWATHGQPSDRNSHPHLDQSGRIAVVHNGVIENYDLLQQQLRRAGHVFKSETDTEVLAHLIGHHYAALISNGNPTEDPKLDLLTRAVIHALKEITGTYGIAVVSADHPGVLVGARRGSPLILGIGDGEHFLSSDANALVAHTRQAVYLNDRDVITLTPEGFTVRSVAQDSAPFVIKEIEYNSQAATREGFPHYMLKEVFEQPATVSDALRGRIDLEESTARFEDLKLTDVDLRGIESIVIVACGTSWHAAMVGEYLLEELAQIPVEVEYASEFRYRHAPIRTNTLFLAISQSGETADTLAGLREARRRGNKVLSICNVEGSSIAREADSGIYLHAGPEIGVASTKAFTSQVAVLVLLATYLGRMRMLSPQSGRSVIQSLQSVPGQIQDILDQNVQIRALALKYAGYNNFFYLGRLINFPVALEGALKLKELSYVHAEGYPAAEMKHGPIALVDEKWPSIVLIPSNDIYDKVLSNLQVLKARKGPVIALATDTNLEIAKWVDDVIYLPKTLDCLFPLLAVVPLQLFAYHMALAKGCDVDRPRNLAKSVTVE